MDTDLPRGPEARALAERVLLSLVHGLGSRAAVITVLGGLVPEILTRGQEPPAPSHLGTTDVDVMLAVHVAGSEPGYEPIEEILQRLGFRPDEKQAGWRWWASVEGRRVKLEFLCDLDDQEQGAVVRPPGCEVLGAANLRGTRYAAADAVEEEIDGPLINEGGTVRLRVRFAGLAGYLMAKAHAVVDRGETKDYYDFAYVVLHNRAGGPRAAAEAILIRFPEVSKIVRLWSEIGDRFGMPDRVGPTNYATQHASVVVDADPALLRNDAVAGVTELVGVIKAYKLNGSEM